MIHAMDTLEYLNVRKLCFWLVLFVVPCFAFGQDKLHNLRFVQKPSSDLMTSNEVQQVYQDRSGFIWLATRNGLCAYDGYKVVRYKSNMDMPDLLTNNNILCIKDDARHNLFPITLFHAFWLPVTIRFGLARTMVYAGMRLSGIRFW